MRLRKLVDFIQNQVGTPGGPDRVPDRVLFNQNGTQDYGYDDYSMDDRKSGIPITRYYNQHGKYYASGLGGLDGSEKLPSELIKALTEAFTKHK